MRKLLTICVVAGFVLLATTAQASIITSVVRTNGATSGLPQIIPGPSPAGLQENSPPYMDRLHRDYAWQQVPAPLLGADYVMTYCDDKSASNVSYAVTVSGAATLYVLVDDRYIAGTGWRSPPYEPLLDPPFPWLTDNSAGAVFTDTGLRLSHTGYHSGSNQYYEGKFWVYAADVSAGIYTLGATRGYEPYTNSRTFYGIAAVVNTPEAMLARLALFITDEVDSGNIAPELEGSLQVKIDAALAALNRGNPNDAKVAMNDLKALINHVEAQIDKKITPDAAAKIIGQANAVIATLSG